VSARRWPTRLPPLRVWVWVAATVVLVVVAALLWRGSDAAATESTTATAPRIPDTAPAAQLSEAWSQPGDPMPRRVVESGRVLVANTHGVRALDVVTGEEAWHYTRANARLCDLTAVNGVVVAAFRTGNRCDEAVALDAATGVREWTRSVNLRGDATLASTDRIVLAASPTGVVTLDPTGNNIRWRYAAPDRCRLLGADVGSTGVAVLQHCTGAPSVQLRLLEGFGGDTLWSRNVAPPDGPPIRLVGADRLVDVVVGDTLLVHSGQDGTVLQSLSLPAGDAETETLHQAGAGDLALLWVRGTLRALDETTGEVRWEVPARGLPAVGSVSDAEPGDASVLVPEEDGFVRRDLVTGSEEGRSTVEGLPSGGRTFLIGPVVVYRLPDEVLGYR
jgi:outer membrane protein assembly factor BamB